MPPLSITDPTIQATVSTLLTRSSQNLASFLANQLPEIFDDWWQSGVVGKLSYQQQRRVEQCETTTLSSLDLAALLRILDGNWFELSRIKNLTREDRHFVKEMQTIRNKWAHIGTNGFSFDDVYRDLDTLQRFVMVIEGDDALVQEVRGAKAALIDMQRPSSKSPENSTDQESSPTHNTSAQGFDPGQIVTLVSNPGIKGAVMAVIPGSPEDRYEVFVDGEKKSFYASQIRSLEQKAEQETPFMSVQTFHAYLSALQISNPGLSTLYSLNAARIDFIPYQFRPVLKFIRSDRPRLLIADGVGVGKTIEAGLILREIQARRDVRSVLTICPRPLVTEKKWQKEMKRFGERFTHLDGRTLRYCLNETDLDGEWPDQHSKCILPYSLFDETMLHGSDKKARHKTIKGLLDLDPPPKFDLVIVDEAHHIRNPSTFTHKGVRFFCDHAEAVVFLTATPIQLDRHDLFVLLNVLRPDLILEEESFRHMSEPNPHINKAVDLIRGQDDHWQIQALESLNAAATTSWGQSLLQQNPDYMHARDQLSRMDLSAEERVQCITDIEDLHTFSGIINRTRRRDIGDFTVRKPETVTIDFTPAQQHLHDELLRIQTEIFKRIHGNRNIKFMMTTIRRQVASCLFGLVPFLKEILSRHMDELAWEEADILGDIPSEAAISSIETDIQTILEHARCLPDEDPKLEALVTILNNKQSMENNRVMLFSSFRHTLNYLFHKLKEHGFRVGMLDGTTPDEDRLVLRDRFKLDRDDPDTLDVLLFSEIGCEGLDYQFCDCMVNYDLPWNPMRIEQRIGRIDRNGQQSESVSIFNMITPGTVDADIYIRCMVRIGVFNNAIGASEEILGEISKEIKEIAENFDLTEAERQKKLNQLSDNKIRDVQEQEKFEQRQLELFGIRLPESRMRKEIDQASSFWLSSASLSNLITCYLKNLCGSEQEYILKDTDPQTLRLSQENRNIVLKDFQKLPRQSADYYRDWENWLKGSKAYQPITFDAVFAATHPDVAFIMPLHPLVRQAAGNSVCNDKTVTTLKVSDQSLPPGKHLFAIYQWQFHGIREDMLLRPVAKSDAVTAKLNDLLKNAQNDPHSQDNKPSPSAWDELDEYHYSLWMKERDKHQERTRKTAEFRLESLKSSHQARMSQLSDQLNQAKEEKIRRMRESQIKAAEADYSRRVKYLEIAMGRGDIVAKVVAYGSLNVERENEDE
jgi:superfamily II DNA or RNA helicase